MHRVWKRNIKGTCLRYTDYMRFYADLIDPDEERRKRKCEDCPGINKQQNVIIVDGDCRFHLLRDLSEMISYSSFIIVPDLNLIKYANYEFLEKELELVESYTPSMTNGDTKSIHVFKRIFGKKWEQELPN